MMINLVLTSLNCTWCVPEIIIVGHNKTQLIECSRQDKILFISPEYYVLYHFKIGAYLNTLIGLEIRDFNNSVRSDIIE